MAEFDVVFREVENSFDVSFGSVNTFGVTMDTVVKVLPDVFIGDYEYTPTNSEQVINAKGKTLADDIIINPIPNNYGLITWNGATLTVS